MKFYKGDIVKSKEGYEFEVLDSGTIFGRTCLVFKNYEHYGLYFKARAFTLVKRGDYYNTRNIVEVV